MEALFHHSDYDSDEFDSFIRAADHKKTCGNIHFHLL